MIKVLFSPGGFFKGGQARFKSLMNEAAEKTAETLGLCGRAAVELVICDAETIRGINLSQRGIDKVTDVLSFPYIKTPVPPGGLVRENYPADYDPSKKLVRAGTCAICLEKALSQAKEYGHSEEREICYLFVHALLHIFGYDHENDNDKRVMRETEEKILSLLNQSQQDGETNLK